MEIVRKVRGYLEQGHVVPTQAGLGWAVYWTVCNVKTKLCVTEMILKQLFC